MRIRSIWALVSTWILFAAVPVSADPTAEPLASEQTGEGSAAGRDTPAVPLIGVSIDGALSSDIMEAAARGLGSPILRGNAIEKKLRLAKLPSGFDIESVEDSFSVGEEAFYKGDIEEASRRFLEIASLYTEKRETLAFYPSLRTAVFKARMHLAVIAHGRKKIDLFHRYLGEAAEIPEMEPSPEDFPPWVCDAFASDKMRAFAPSKAGGIRLASENGCMLSVLGRVVEHLEMQLPEGSTFVRVRCGDKSSPVQEVEIETGKTVDFHPTMVLNTSLGRMGRDAVLTAASISRNGYLMSDIRALGEALEADRVAAVIATPHKMEVVLMDTGLKRAVRRSVVEGDKTMESVERAAAALVARAPGEPVPSDAGGASSETGTQAGMKTLKRPWYRDPSAWVLTLTGAAALGAGIGLMQAYDLESRQAPFAVSLTALGGGLTASGGILFFIRPARSEKSAASRAGVTVGAAVQGAF